MGGEERLLVVLAPEESELLLNSPELVVGIQIILSPREGGRLSLEEIRKVISVSGPTSSMRGRVVHEGLEESSLSLTILLYLHQHICHAWR